MAKLPEPKVEAKVAPADVGHVANITISRDGTGKARNYKGSGSDADTAVADAVRQIIVDPHTSEYVP